MKQKQMMAVASGAVLALSMTACSSGGTTGTASTGGSSVAGQNAAVGKVFQPSSTTGGTLRFGMPGDWDSVDPEFILPAGLAIFVTVLAFNLFGDGLRDALDPKSR